MFDKKQVQKAIKEIDDNLASLNGPRQAHIALTSDVGLVQEVCLAYFIILKQLEEETKGKKDDGTDKPTEHPKPGDKDK